MRRSRVRAVGLGLLGGLVACATPTSPELEQARALYEEAARDPQIAEHSSVALYEAEKELDRAEAAWREEDSEETAHRSELLSRRLEIARVTAEGGAARAEAQSLHQQREQILLEARTREAARALSAAEAAREAAEKRAAEAEAARQEAELARQQAAEASTRAEELQKTLADLEARPTERGIVLTLGDVLFEFNESTLKPGAQLNLQRLVEFLKRNADREVLVEGHTDSAGSDAYNLELSRRRAESVAGYLVKSGIPSAQLLPRGYGEAYPVAANDTAAGRQRNRRVEVVILDPGQRASERALPPVGAE
jgi:outer membrane protein OmpA-like peptidoglycan-associated protein